MANGGGLILGAIGNGRLLDFNYRRARDKLLRSTKDKTTNESVLQNRHTFPLESVRLQWAPHFVIMYAACVIGWGWCVEKSVLLVGPLFLQVVRTFASFLLPLSCAYELCSWFRVHIYHQYYHDAYGGSHTGSKFVSNCVCMSFMRRGLDLLDLKI